MLVWVIELHIQKPYKEVRISKRCYSFDEKWKEQGNMCGLSKSNWFKTSSYCYGIEEHSELANWIYQTQKRSFTIVRYTVDSFSK